MKSSIFIPSVVEISSYCTMLAASTTKWNSHEEKSYFYHRTCLHVIKCHQTTACPTLKSSRTRQTLLSPLVSTYVSCVKLSVTPPNPQEQGSNIFIYLDYILYKIYVNKFTKAEGQPVCLHHLPLPVSCWNKNFNEYNNMFRHIPPVIILRCVDW